MDVSPAVWTATLLGLVPIIVLDLVVISRRQREVTVKDATLWVTFYISLAACFAVGLFVISGSGAGGEFVAGYITEYSLSVDNLFVFVLIISRFGVPLLAQDKVLYIGIGLSLVLRGAFIAAGAAAIARFNWVFYLFGAFLIYTAVRLALEREDGADDDLGDGVAVRLVRRVLPSTSAYHGSRIRLVVSGRRVFTPLLLVITAIAVANVIFALDSIPAIFGLTKDAYIVFTANAFALMGLRQLYFLVGGLLERLVYLSVGLSVILGFIGVKLVLEALLGDGVTEVDGVAVPRVGIASSLGFIVAVLAVTAVASLLRGRWIARRVTE